MHARADRASPHPDRAPRRCRRSPPSPHHTPSPTQAEAKRHEAAEASKRRAERVAAMGTSRGVEMRRLTQARTKPSPLRARGPAPGASRGLVSPSLALARPHPPPAPHPPPPQEEILEEAKLTEADNRASLAMMLHQEEEKRRVIVRERDLKGPRVRFVSKRNGDSVTNTYTFVETPVPPAINAVAPPKPQPQRCAVTQAPAKYLDPSTGAPYANLEAYRHLRGRQGSRRQSVSFGTPSGGDV